MGRRGTHEIGDDMTQTPFHWDCPKRGVERQKQHQHQMHRITFAFSHTNGSHDYEQDCLSVIHYLFNNNNNLKTLRYTLLSWAVFFQFYSESTFLWLFFSNYMRSLYFLCSSGTLCNLRGPQQHWWRLLNIFNGNNDHHRCCPISFSSREVASKASELQTWRVENGNELI